MVEGGTWAQGWILKVKPGHTVFIISITTVSFLFLWMSCNLNTLRQPGPFRAVLVFFAGSTWSRPSGAAAGCQEPRGLCAPWHMHALQLKL